MVDLGVDTFKNMLLQTLNNVNTEPELRSLASEFRQNNVKIFSNLTDEQYNHVVDELVQTLQVSLSKSFTIEEGKHEPWFKKYYKDIHRKTRWDRYVDYLKKEKGFGINVVREMEQNLFTISDLLGNPNDEKNFARKGLVVGDVQSGKTANYVGLMNLATEIKYKLMIVLTGTTNALREQTQIRIEEGLGISKSNLKKGVRALKEYGSEDFIDPWYLTSIENDFNKSALNSLGASIETTNVPFIIITKKNSNSLKNILSWLEEYSKKKNYEKIDSSVLLIDDESDFASINTRSEDESPTAINGKIRDILNLFSKSSYIGFTATPYANIFIDPTTNDEMYKQDLFPKDYIFVLGESSEYVGMNSIFADSIQKDEKDNSFMLVPISSNEVESFLPLKHKKDFVFRTLAPSMKHAINLFLIGNVIRDLRGDKTKHRSMLVNISRFTNVHTHIKSLIGEYLNEIKVAVRIFGNGDINDALKKSEIKELKESFEKYEFEGKSDYSFEYILSQMNDSIYSVRVEIVNKDEKGVDYISKEDKGEEERVIVIGGFALSRGLTLEGLMISYYWRNSVMYDSLLQMGRWFGYRPKYKDLCRIFMPLEVISDFKFIALATKELKEDLAKNSVKGVTPKEFGIRVRSGQTGLIITSRSKMRTGKKATASADFNLDIIETYTFSIADDKRNTDNYELVKNFVEQHKYLLSRMHYNKDKINGLKNISKDDVIEFFSKYSSVDGSKFDSSLLTEWLRKNENENLDYWDIVFITGSSEKTFDYGNLINGKASIRTVYHPTGMTENIYRNKRSRLGSPTDGEFGLTREQIALVKEQIKMSDIKKNPSSKDYFVKEINRKPIISIYSVVPESVGGETLSDKPIVLLSVGIPDLGRGKTKYVNYTVNKIYQEINQDDMEVSEE